MGPASDEARRRSQKSKVIIEYYSDYSILQ